MYNNLFYANIVFIAEYTEKKWFLESKRTVTHNRGYDYVIYAENKDIATKIFKETEWFKKNISDKNVYFGAHELGLGGWDGKELDPFDTVVIVEPVKNELSFAYLQKNMEAKQFIEFWEDSK